MTRKQLPKAIVRLGENVHAFASSMVADEEAPEPAPRAAAPVFNQIEAEPALAVSSAPIANDSAPTASFLPEPMAAKRRTFANKIVERHRTYAAVGGLLPLPIVNIAGVTAVNVRMVQQLSELYQVPFQRDRTRALIVSLIGGAVPTGFGAATSSTLMWIIPGGMLVGLGVSAITAGALTRGIGQVFVESFENGARGEA
ncbi:MAG TPA: YcjF family protein [Xanthobacteraceae bacterium]|jgi:uncharacterized protein (DUF697 family)|nr:YcjF family protein [Xanthobacteraceae bacterium]